MAARLVDAAFVWTEDKNGRLLRCVMITKFHFLFKATFPQLP